MSAGPIKQWRDGHKPPKTTPVSERLRARRRPPHPGVLRNVR